MNNAGTTVVLTIAENMANDGQHFWDPPLSLPDADTFYKMRIRTMDGQYSDSVGPFTITKAKAPAGPPAITVIAPVGPAQVGIGIIYPVRWKSTCSTAAEGPAHDGFDIRLMDSGGTQVVKTLLYSMSAVYDGGNPDGSHSWHWDWHIHQNEKAGTYRIAVTSLSGKCTGKGAPFQLVYPQELKDYTFSPKAENCWRITSSINFKPALAGEDLYNSPSCPGQAKVWFWFYHNEEEDSYAKEVGRSKLTPNNQYWYKDKGHLLSAKITIERTKRVKETTNADIDDKCLGGVLVLFSDQTCAGLGDSFANISGSVGTAFPVNASQDGAWEVDLSNAYLPRFQQNKPDYGVVLYPAHEGYPCPWEKCIVKMGECYKVTMTFRFAKDITH